MSAINGDKSRHQINRKRGVKRRMKIREMLEARRQSSGAKETPASGAPRPASDRSR
jgi:hypothetical protein